mgnify:CR=1 FL=1
MPVTVTDSNGQAQTFATENEVQGNISLAQQELERQINFARREFERRRSEADEFEGPGGLGRIIALKQQIASQLPAVVVGFPPTGVRPDGGFIINITTKDQLQIILNNLYQTLKWD